MKICFPHHVRVDCLALSAPRSFYEGKQYTQDTDESATGKV